MKLYPKLSFIAKMWRLTIKFENKRDGITYQQILSSQI